MRWLKRRERREVILYGKPGCHLCDEARRLLQRLGRRYRLELTETDITTDPSLYRQYDVLIPVIKVAGGATLEAPIKEDALRRALDEAG